MDDNVTVQLQRAIAVAEENVGVGGGPFGAVLLMPDGQRFEAGNRVTLDNDPTAHAEVGVIRRACRDLGTFDLSGAQLFSSCEPCPMCLAAALWARVSRVYYSADRHAAAAAGFDDAAFYDYFEGKDQGSLMTNEQVQLTSSNAPFELWLSTAGRTEY